MLLQLIKAADSHLPGLTYNHRQRQRFAEFEQALAGDGEPKRVLVVGAGNGGSPLHDPLIVCVLTDVIDDDSVDVVCDAHDLPFPDGSFDGVMAIAVLEHVADPVRVAAEMHRVLGDGGLVYSEIPFLQRVHAGAWDFTRFTMLGHRRLFRMFDTITLEPVAGPASSLAWAIDGFLLAAIGRNRPLWLVTNRLTRLFFCWLPLLDRFLLRTPGAADAACGTVFVGRRRLEPVADELILGEYRGACPTPAATARG